MTSASSSVEPLTVAELVQGGPLAGATLAGTAPLDRPVRGIVLINDVAETAMTAPHCGLVLTKSAAKGGWAVEIALRHAWERAAACVVAPSEVVGGPSADLATRLGIPLIAVRTDINSAAMAMAAAVTRPEAARSTLTARCALRLAEGGFSAKAVLNVLNEHLPGIQFAFVSPGGQLAAGSRTALEAWQDSGTEVLAEPVNGPDGLELGRLLALLSVRSRGWQHTVHDVLRIAGTSLAAWAATSRLRAEREPRVAAAVLSALLVHPHVAEDEELIAHATALGWPLHGKLAAVALAPLESPTGDCLSSSLAAAWAGAGLGDFLIPHAEGWICWVPLDDDAGDDELTKLRDRCASALWRVGTLVPLAAGIGGPGTDISGLRAAIHHATAAAAVARNSGPGTVVTATELGPSRLLAALPRDLAEPARQVLAPLLEADADGTLLATLGAILDSGGSAKEAAARLGVHRNTVATRLDRLRDLGIDPGDPAARLPLHLACHVLQANRQP